MKNLILISDGKNYEFNDIKELKKFLVPNLSKMDKLELERYMYSKVFGFCMLNNLQIIETTKGVYEGNFKIGNEEKLINKAIIIDNLDTYILSLCKFNVIVLLEEVNNRNYTKNIKIENETENYVVVNSFANKILNELVGEEDEK